MKTTPRSPAELADALIAIFPSLPRDFGASGESVFVDAGPTYHSVLREFAYFLAKDLQEFSDRQLRRFAELVERSQQGDEDLADAIRACLLPQMRQPQVQQRLAPFLALDA
ncbi:hypothetical protein [Ramlibacter sp. AN1133]|uniref:hypothetical protein n=1 Tax=Ramlibacter sp. AN1133 TaxID=3133429 RepID=UPI0030C412D0